MTLVAYLPLIDEYVQEMQDNGINESRMGSEWVSNIVLVHKTDGALRYCIDYRGLNMVTTKANYPLPRIDACHDSLGETPIFPRWVCDQGTDRYLCVSRILIRPVL